MGFKTKSSDSTSELKGDETYHSLYMVIRGGFNKNGADGGWSSTDSSEDMSADSKLTPDAFCHADSIKRSPHLTSRCPGDVPARRPCRQSVLSFVNDLGKTVAQQSRMESVVASVTAKPRMPSSRISGMSLSDPSPRISIASWMHMKRSSRGSVQYEI